MTIEQGVIFAILVATFGLFVWGRWRHDVVALMALGAVVLAGLTPAGEAFDGFGHPATITVTLVLVISRALQNAGVSDAIAGLLTRYAAGSAAITITTLCLAAAVLSAFMNNVGALAMLLPVSLYAAKECDCPPSLVLMPLSFASILGGLTTLIGTPPNVIIATYRADALGVPFDMFDFSPVGLAVAGAGLVFVVIASRWLVPHRDSAGDGGDLFEIGAYVTEVRIPKETPLVGLTLKEVEEKLQDRDVVILGLIRRGKRLSMRGGQDIKASDILIIEAGPSELDRLLSDFKLKITGEQAPPERRALLSSETEGLAETVIAPGSRLDGRVVENLRLHRSYGVRLLAVSRQGTAFRGRLRTFRLRVGDILLLHGPVDRLPQITETLGCFPLAGRGLSFGIRKRLPLAAGLFAAAIAAASFGVVSLPIALLAAAIAMVLTGIVPVREIYDSIDWPVVVLLGAMIPVGGALENTGATTLIASTLAAIGGTGAPVLALVLVLVVTMSVSDVLNNAATAVVMAPISVGLARTLDVSADPFLMTVAIGASCAFLTPIGHQNNALVMGPGGYRFGDYWRLGLPLEALIVIVSVPMILWIWPL